MHESAYLVDVDDPSTFADRIWLLLKDPGIAEHMGESGRRLVVEEYNLHKQVAKLKQLIAN